LLDWLIKGAQVIDGTGQAAWTGDVGIDDARIVLDGLHDASAERVIDGPGLVVAPGFIDTHTHSDFELLTDPDHSAKLLQGVTTEVIGLDGLSFAPLSPRQREEMLEYVSGIDGLPPEGARWSSVEEFLALFDGGIACNAAYMVPHGALRIEAMGWKRRPCSADELVVMKRLLREGLAQGAFGISTGLTYAPCEFAETSELIALAEVAAEYGGLYDPHERFSKGDLLDCTTETIAIGRESGCAVLISHLFVLPKFAGRAEELVSLIDDAIAEGLDVQYDAHPYLEGNSWLAAIAPAWLGEGGPHTLKDKLCDAEVRSRVMAETDWEWDKLVISGIAGGDPEGLAGSSVAEIAQERGMPPAEVLCDLLAEYGWGIAAITGGRDPVDVPPIITHPACMICSDGILIGEHPHPRGFGVFPRILREYWRESGRLSLEEAVHKMSGLPAQRLGLGDRGVIAEGKQADLVLFDPQTVSEGNSMQEPKAPPLGIEYVFVNGQLAVDGGKRTNVVAGEMLRH